MVEVGRGGTEQARFERDVIWDTILHRLTQLQLGDASLCFGRIDHDPASGPTSAARPYYIGRLAVADERQEPVVVDWRAPVAEPFYRATGRSPMGLARRRHFATRGRQLLNIEDELFGEHTFDLGGVRPTSGALGGHQRSEPAPTSNGISGYGALISALETSRSGRLGDIVATIQGEQDEIIRAPLPGVLVVQGGPGTGKTVVALHRAAYLLYTHRFPLEDQGVLVIGPNRLFLAYIEQVLPSLGEAGVELAVLADLIDTGDRCGARPPDVARIKGDERMVGVLAEAVRDRKRGLRRDLRVPSRPADPRRRRRPIGRIVADARRRFRPHNAGRRFVEAEVLRALAESGSRTPLDARRGTRPTLRRTRGARSARVDVAGPHAGRAAARPVRLEGAARARPARATLSDDELAALHRPRVDDGRRRRAGPRTTCRCSTRPAPCSVPGQAQAADDDEIRTYGHLVVDEAQDLSPMQLRMLTRRSLNGSMTVVGDIAQSTGAWAHADWDEVLRLLPDRRPSRRAELTVGYRIPAPNMELAARVLAVVVTRPAAAPVGAPGRPPARVRGRRRRRAARPGRRRRRARRGRRRRDGNVAVICPAR